MGEVVADDVGVAVALCCYDGGANLAQSDAVSPSLAVEGECCASVGAFLCDIKGPERLPDLQEERLSAACQVFYGCGGGGEYPGLYH